LQSMESKLSNEQMLSCLREQFGDAIEDQEIATDGITTVFVQAQVVHKIVEWLYNHEELKVQFLTNITGIHYPDNEKNKEFVIVYHLHSWTNNARLRLKAYLPIANPSIQTVTDVFRAANWIERETYDFFGITFVGHPNLKRILNEDSMDYFPMRKEYQLEDTTRQDKDNRYFGR